MARRATLSLHYLGASKRRRNIFSAAAVARALSSPWSRATK